MIFYFPFMRCIVWISILQMTLYYMLQISVTSFILVYAASYAAAGPAYMAALLCTIRVC